MVETLDRMVPRMMNATAGNMVKRWCEGKGITVKTSTMVTALNTGTDGIEVQFDKGAAQRADLVVVATGVKSNIGFLEGSGVKMEDGMSSTSGLPRVSMASSPPAIAPWVPSTEPTAGAFMPFSRRRPTTAGSPP